MPRPLLASTAPPDRVLPIVLICLILPAALLALATPATAQRCLDEWSAPVVCHVEVSVAPEGERRATRVEGRRLELPSRSEVELFVDPYDQWDRRFPLDRFEVRLESDRRCGDLVTISRRDEGRFLIETGSRDGRCDLVLWVPGNLNLDRQLTIEVNRARRAAYSHGEAAFIARALYRGLLGRDGEPSGVQSAALEIQRAGVASEIRNMLRSPEYARTRSGLDPMARLDDLYRGLLGRRPDNAGVRHYLDDVRRGGIEGVALDILRSPEFEDRMAREVR